MIIRAMTQSDVDAVYEIEKSAHITPWNEKLLSDCINVGYSCFVLVEQNQIRGFMIARQLVRQCHLLNLCIAPKHQGRGFGGALLIYLMEGVKDSCYKIQLEVRPSNHIARKLYAKLGFKESGIKKNYYVDTEGTYEDALLLMYKW